MFLDTTRRCFLHNREEERCELAGVFARKFYERGMERAVAREYFFALRLERSAFVVGDLAARLLQDEATGCDVPGVATTLVVSIKPSGGDVAKVEGGRPEPPHALCAHREAPEEVEGRWHLFTVVRKSC